MANINMTADELNAVLTKNADMYDEYVLLAQEVGNIDTAVGAIDTALGELVSTS